MEDEFLDKKDRKSKGELITRSRGRERKRERKRRAFEERGGYNAALLTPSFRKLAQTVHVTVNCVRNISIPGLCLVNGCLLNWRNVASKWSN